ncbi:CDC48 family AAA ATPase [Candidatus Micrarchaeota archaeon]|nr:CDC48 family AAA ATPase [Candidatus Micrarchaeota archaeon]
MVDEIELKVAEAMQIDYGKRIVRVDSQARKVLGLTTGDVIEIKGKKSTGAIILPAHPQDEGANIVRMDGILRQNTGVGLGDRVKIKKAAVKYAKKLVLAPNQPSRYAPGFSEFVKKNLMGKPLTKGDVLSVNVFGTSFPFAVAQTVPSGIVLVTESTEITLKEEPVKELGKIATISYEDIGGLKDEIQKVREMVELPMRHPEIFVRLGIEPPKGVLIYGTPGCGKTLLARAVANESEAHFITINGPEIVSKFVGEAEEKLRNIFQEAEDNAPSIIFIDELDAIAPKREEVVGEVEKRIVSQLLTIMDGLKSRGQVVVIGATNRPNAIDPALRRPGRFDREIEIGVPDKRDRKEILQIHTRGMPKYHWEGEVAAHIFLNLIKKVKNEGRLERAREKHEDELSKLRQSDKAIRQELQKLLLEKENIERDLEASKKRNRENTQSSYVLSHLRQLKESFESILGLVNEKTNQLSSISKKIDKLESEIKLIKFKGGTINSNLDSILSLVNVERDLRIEYVSIKKIREEKYSELQIAEAIIEELKLNKTILSSISNKSDEKIHIHEKNITSIIIMLKQLLLTGLLSSYEIENAEKEVLDKSAEKMMDEIGNTTHGFVGADLQSLSKEAAMRALRRVLPDINLQDSEIPEKILNELRVTRTDFANALKEVQPSALREVFVEIPNVKWEQIGGLEAIKQELREAVDLPLKRPEVFEKMGIRPVRGILLFGAPGTGKTLLAKAVATESEANFISVKGPELISKWVGESLAFDEEVIVLQGDRLQRMKIGELVDAALAESGNQYVLQHQAMKIMTLDERGRGQWAPVTDFLAHPAPSQLYEIHTRTGRRIRVTGDHALFVLDEGVIKSIPVRNLIPRESFVAVPSQLPSLDVTPVFDLSRLLAEEKNLAFFPKAGTRFVRKTNGGDALPASLSFNEDWAFLVGFWLAEGDYNNGCLRFHNQNPENRARLTKAFQRLGIHYSENKYSLVASRLSALVFRKAFGLECGAYEKRVPAFASGLPRLLLAALLNGYYSGDGSVYGNAHRHYIEASTVSEGLSNDLMLLLLRFGIVGTHYERVDKRYGIMMHKVQFSGVSQFERFGEIGFSDIRRNAIVAAYTRGKKWRRSAQIPLDSTLRRALEASDHAVWAQGKTIGKKALLEFLSTHGTKALEPYRELAENDVHWDLIARIDKIPYSKPFVYDLGVSGTERFLAGFGGLFVHNSEKAVREVFRKARLAAPCIIFIDEIDAIAPMRGYDEGSKVTERMVNALLTEMDGLQNLKDIVVIAATNRVDIVDSGLLRPGRFDKLLEIPVPDEPARETILKVHTARMPMEKSVDLKKLARMTPDFSGADLEALCREAGMEALRQNLEATSVNAKHFEKALSASRPSLVQKKKREDASYS